MQRKIEKWKKIMCGYLLVQSNLYGCSKISPTNFFNNGNIKILFFYRENFDTCIYISSVQSLIHVQLFETPWIAARQASLSITNSRSSLKLTSIESVVPSSHLILCHPLLLLPSIFPSIRIFSNESVLHISWPEYWSFSFSISPSNEYSGLISFRMDWFDFLAVQGTLKSFLQPHCSKHQFFCAQLSL